MRLRIRNGKPRERKRGTQSHGPEIGSRATEDEMKRWRYAALLLSTLTLTLLLAFPACAGTSTTATVEVSWIILPFQSLTISGVAAAETSVVSHYDLRQPTEADFALGYIEENGALTLSAASNIPWVVKVHALEPNMGRSDDGTYVKPLSDFSLRANGGSYFSITTFDQTLATGGVGVHPILIDYKVKTEKDSYKQGDYGLTLVYTITGE